MIKHIVMWKLKNPGDAAKFKAQLDSCKGLVPGMREFEAAVRTEGLEANVDVVLVSAFDDRAALQAYLEHPVHVEVSGVLGGLRESRTVLDYET
ncbi:Dabb family protein [Variovorax ureilyticus]|uniref:Dabb family protein n=1 Tax=Variovorax ureilyticus TaxID=1836198 RepID=A0ABU8V7H4_9BURK